MDDEIRFYRANSTSYGFLSNLFPCTVAMMEPPWNGRVFDTAERAFQFTKPKDPAVAEWLVKAPKAHICATSAHALLFFDVRPDWQQVKTGFMKQVVMAKFSQNNDLRKLLLETGKARIIEASKSDSFWGIGKKGDGLNMLGRIIEETRDALDALRGKTR